MKVSLEGTGDKQELVIRVPVAQNPPASASGKTYVVASSRGNVKTDLQVNGQPLTVGFNAYIPKVKAS